MKKNYRNKHWLIIGFVVYMVVSQFLVYIIPNHDKLVNAFMIILWVICLSAFSGPYEKDDELTKANISKANGITLAVLLIFIFLSAVIGNNLNSETALRIFASDVYFYTFFSAIGLRSIIFLTLDKTLSDESGDE